MRLLRSAGRKAKAGMGFAGRRPAPSSWRARCSRWWRCLSRRGCPRSRLSCAHRGGAAQGAANVDGARRLALLPFRRAHPTADCVPLLVYAAMYGRKDSVETLLKMDACVDAPIVADRDDAPSDGMTALMYACKDNHVDIVRLLLDSGADHKVRTSDGRSVMNIATADCAKAIRRFTAESKRRTQIEKAVESTIYSLKTALAAMQDAEAAAAAHTTSESTEGKQRELVLSAAKAKAHAQDALVAEVCSAEASMFGAVAKSPLVAPLLAQAKALLEDKSQAEKAKAAVAEEMPVATSDRPHATTNSERHSRNGGEERGSAAGRG